MRRGLPPVLVAFALMSRPLAADTGFLDRTVPTAAGPRYVQVFVPRDWTPARRWPVILFLHGAGERGADGRRHTEVGLPSAIRRGVAPDSAIVVMPQAAEGRRWFLDMADLARAALDTALVEFHGDPDRVYLTGMSMGGQGAWFLAHAQPERFAALVPVCARLFAAPDIADTVALPHVAGPDPYATLATGIGRLPVWVFHSADDPVIPVSESRRIVALLEAASGDVRYTEYADAGHGAWERAYDDSAMWTWLFAQRRPSR
jgi:predicted peptidase